MIIFRIVAVALPQILLVLDIGARYDLLLGFNRTDYGFTILLFLFLLTPLVTLSWTVTEVIVAVRRTGRKNEAISFSMPLLALIILLESVLIDIYLLSQARM